MSKHFHIKGRRAYGPFWEVARRFLCFMASGGRTASSKALTPRERRHILRGLPRHPIWPQTPEAMHLWADRERARAELTSQS